MLQEGPGDIKEIGSAKSSSKKPAGSADATPAAPAVASATDDESDVFDVLIIGGGATGAGCAVDAATRGLKVAMVERDDFSSGKSFVS